MTIITIGGEDRKREIKRKIQKKQGKMLLKRDWIS